MAEDKLTNLYNAFVNNGYAMEPEAQFRENLKDSKKRKAAYDALVADGYNMEPFADFESNIGFGAPAPTSEPKLQAQSTATAPDADPEQAPAQIEPEQPAWQPIEQEKIRTSYQMHTMLNDFNQKSKERIAQTKRMAEPFTLEGRKKLDAAKFQAQIAGTPTKVMGLTPPTPHTATEAVDGSAQQQPVHSGQSPVPYGVKYIDGKAVTQWLLPDGMVTTDLTEADQAESGARTARLRHQFENRMKENGLDPAKPEDVTRQSIFDRMEENRSRQYSKDVEVAVDASSDMEWHDDEGFFDNLGRLARNSIMRSENVQYGSAVSEESDADLHNLKAENYILSKALTRLDANGLKKSEGILGGMFDVRNNLSNLGKGFSDAVRDENLYLGGMVELNMARQLIAIDGKVRNGIPLSDTDKNLVYAALLNINAEQSGSVPHMYTAAVTTAEMAPFMIEMMANPASGLSQSMVRQFGRSALKRFGKDAIKKNAKKYALGKAAAIMIGDVAQSAVLANTLQTPKTVADAMQRFVGNPIVDGNGRVTGFDGDHDAIEAFAKAEGASVIENYTEMLGNHFGTIAKYLGKGGAAVANKAGLGRLVENTSELIGRVKGSDWGKAIGEIEKRAQWNGTLGEIMEEEAGIILNSMFVGDNQISDLVDADQQIDIVLGVGLFGGFVSGIKTGGYIVGRRSANMNLRNSERTGKSVFGEEWRNIQGAIDNAEDSDVSDIVSELTHKANSQEQAGAILNYAHSLMQARGYNLAQAKKNAELNDIGETSPGHVAVIEAENQSESAYDDGQEIYSRHEQGDPTAQADVDAIALRMQEAYQAVEDAFGAEAEYYMFHVNENPWALLNDPELTTEQQDAVLYYINAKAALDGVMDASNEAADRKRAEIEQSVGKRTHKDSGIIIPATMKVDDRQVYVVKGDVVMFPDGSTVDVRNSSESVVVMDAQTGEYEFTSPDQIFKVSEAVNPQDELDSALSVIEQEQMSVFGENAIAPEEPAEGEAPIDQSADVSPEPAPETASTEEYDRGYEQGLEEAAKADDAWIANLIKIYSQNTPESMPETMKGQLDAFLYEQQRRAQAVPKNTESVPSPAETTENVAENASEAFPTADTVLSRIPTDEQGEPMFEAVDKDTAWDGLVEAVGGETDAVDIAMAQVQQASTDLETLKKKPPTLKAPKLKGSPMAMAQAKREAAEQYQRDLARYNQQIADTEARLAAWNGIVGVYTSRNAEMRRLQEEARRQREAIAHDEAVARFNEEQRIKAEKQAEQERIGVHAVNPKIRAKWGSAPKIEGHTDAITLPDGSAVRGRYVLTEAGAASASHDVNNAYMPTEGFPIDENGQSVNDRDYQRDKDAQRIVEQMAGAYDNRALQTPVIVSRDGVVLSGNNRTMSGDLAARQGTDKAYVDYLREFGHKYGFTPEQVQGMSNPRLVFVPDEDMPYDATTFSRFNAQEMKSQSKPEAAVKLGKIVPDNVFTDLANDISRYDRLSDYYADEKAVSHALGALMQAGVINDKQMPEMRTGTALSAAGKELIENTLIGKVFQTTPDAVRQIISMPALRHSIVMGLNEIANNRTLARDGYDISEELANAVDLVARAKTAMPDVYTDGMPVSPFGRMQGLFDDEYGNSRVTDATALLLADILNSGKPSDLRKVLTSYNKEAAEASGGQMDIFSGSITTKEEILTNVNEHFRNATPKEQQAIVDAAIAERKRRAAAEAEQRGRDQASEQVENAVERSADAPVTTVEPTEAQKAAGNYKMEHRRVDGYNISIENAKGSVRRGKDADGKQWETTMQNDYGYIRGTEGVDGDHIDVFLSDTPDVGDVFVVDQVNEDGSFDEHKVMYGFPTEQAARDAYLSNYEPGWTGLGAITHVSKDEFKKWIGSSKRKTKPFADYKSIKPILYDNQGNLIDENGNLIIEDVKSIADITCNRQDFI